jgi:hypothetical protein
MSVKDFFSRTSTIHKNGIFSKLKTALELVEWLMW